MLIRANSVARSSYVTPTWRLIAPLAHRLMRAERDQEVESLDPVVQRFVKEAEHHRNRRGSRAVRDDDQHTFAVSPAP